jgi:signal transduction histidine kinase
LKKVYFIFVSILILYSCSKGKGNNELTKPVSDSINYYFREFDKRGLSKEQQIKILNKTTRIIQQSNNSLKLRELNYDLISKYYNVASWDNYKKASDILLKNSLASNDVISEAKSYRSLGNYFSEVGIPDSSFLYYTKSEKIYGQIKDYDGYSTILLKKGIIQFNASDHLGAEVSLSKALSAVKKTNDKGKRYVILNQLGLNSNQLKDFDKAINYFNEAIKVVNESDFPTSAYLKSVCQSNLGLVYQNLKQHRRAIAYFNSSLKYDNLKEEYPVAYSNIIDNLAYSKLQENNFQGLPGLFHESLQLRKTLKDNSAIVISYIHLSEYYYRIHDDERAISFSNQALNLARINKNPVDLLFSLKQASVVDNKMAARHSDDYLRITDSLQTVDRNSKDNFARIQLGTQEIIQENDNLENRNRTLLYVFVITFILVALLFVVRAQRARTRELLFKQNQQKANEEIFNLMMSQQSIIDESRAKEKKRLAQDLHDGVLGRMFGLRLNLDSLNSSTDADAQRKRLELLNELKTIEQDIREISHDLNREKLVLINNFVSIVHNLLEEQKSLHAAQVEYQIETKIDWDKIGNAIKINLYRILQEGLQNINKYANAGLIKVDISGDAENVYLKIEDDGIGFDVNKKSKGIGMQNMISRTNDCQGIIDISSKKGQGTKIIITVPTETKQLTTEQA